MKYVIQYDNGMKDKIETLNNFVIRYKSQRQNGETDEQLAKRVLNGYWNTSRTIGNKGGYGIFEPTQTSIQPILEHRLAYARDYIEASNDKRSLMGYVAFLENQAHSLFTDKAILDDLMTKMENNDNGNNMEYSKVKAEIDKEITDIINPAGTKLIRMVTDLNNKFYAASFDETRLEFTLILTTSMITVGGATLSDCINEVAYRATDILETLKQDLHTKDNDYRTDTYVNLIKRITLDDGAEKVLVKQTKVEQTKAGELLNAKS